MIKAQVALTKAMSKDVEKKVPEDKATSISTQLMEIHLQKQATVEEFVAKAISTMEEGPSEVRDLPMFNIELLTGKTVPFRYEQKSAMKKFKTYANDYYSIASFSFMDEVRVGHTEHKLFSEVVLVDNIHTVKARKYGNCLAEIVFQGDEQTCTTKSTFNGGNWSPFKLSEKEAIIGMYGEYFESEHYKVMKQFGLIIGTFE